MMDTLSATLIKDHRLFDSIEGDETEAVILYRVETPFVLMKDANKDATSDVRIKGPVYVGDDDMLDRHNELVDNDAIMAAWEGYKKNPVVLYNHSKTYGVIGVMEDVQLGKFKKPDGTKIEVPIGVARIDSGEKDITRKISKGMLRAFSIGFIAKAAVKECKDEDSCYMRFTEIEWLETSVVDVPASPGALFSVEKSLLSADISNVDFSIDEIFDANKAGQFQAQPKVHATVLRSAEEKSCGGGSSCTCDSKEVETEEKHIVAIEEDDSNYYLTFGKAEDLDDMDDAGYKPDDEDKDLKGVIGELLDRISILEATLEAAEEKGGLSDSVNTPLSDSVGLMTSEQVVVEDADIEEKTLEDAEISDAVTTEEVVLEPTLETKDADESEEDEADETDAEDEAEEETDETEAEAEDDDAEDDDAEDAEDDADEEVEEEDDDAEADEVEEKSDDLPSTVDILMQVVKALTDVETSVANMTARIDETEELKAALNERDAHIQTLTEEKAAAEQEAEIEAEVAKRIAERVGDAPAPKAKAERKSLVPSYPPKEKTGVTKLDPQPSVTPGMAGLAGWLEGRLSDRTGVEN